MRRILWLLTIALIVLMPNQHGFRLGGTDREVVRQVEVRQPDGSTETIERTDIKHEGGINVTPADLLVVIIFLLWAGYSVTSLRFIRSRMPSLAVLVLLFLVLISALGSDSIGTGLKEFVQLALYFGAGWLIFANVIETREQYDYIGGVFALVVGIVVIVALRQYFHESRGGNAFEVSAFFMNRNELGMFFSFALPFVFALALNEKRFLRRLALYTTIIAGCVVTLSGGALLAIIAGLIVVAALHSQRALIFLLLAVLILFNWLPGRVAMPNHGDIVASSISVYLSDNYFDVVVRSPDDAPQAVAMRYKHWHAAMRLIRSPFVPLFGVGPGRYSEHDKKELGFEGIDKPAADTDSVRDFNIRTTEPDTFNTYLVVLVEYGPLVMAALLWVFAFYFGRSIRQMEMLEHSDWQARMYSIASAGAIAGAAVGAIFSNILVRGIALPFIFTAISGILFAKLPSSRR